MSSVPHVVIIVIVSHPPHHCHCRRRLRAIRPAEAEASLLSGRGHVTIGSCCLSPHPRCHHLWVISPAEDSFSSLSGGGLVVPPSHCHCHCLLLVWWGPHCPSLTSSSSSAGHLSCKGLVPPPHHCCRCCPVRALSLSSSSVLIDCPRPVVAVVWQGPCHCPHCPCCHCCCLARVSSLSTVDHPCCVVVIVVR